MNNLPGYVRIMGLDYSIEEDDTLCNFDHAGINKLHTHEILISNSLSNEMKIATILHECVEAINFMMEMGLKHRQITALASGLYQLLADNPDLCACMLAQCDDVEVEDAGKPDE